MTSTSLLDDAAVADTVVDEAFVRRAVAQANPNALRLALYELTGDPELAAMTVEDRHVRGGAMVIPVLAKPDRAVVAEKAANYLLSGGAGARAYVPPDRGRAAELLTLFGTPMDTPQRIRLALDELGLPDPASGAVPAGVTPEMLATRSVTIVGAGVSGIAVAIRLKALGIPFRIFERQSGIGGTWHLNDYPEARVDISNFIYQFRFERNYRWQSLYAPQSEIKAYLEHIVARHGLSPQISLGASVERARWDATSGCWRIAVRHADGTDEAVVSDFLISAAGLFSTPNLPAIPGLDDFAGPVMHTTGWLHDYDFAGKRVALIGNGSSGVQLMPWLARTADHLTVFQRSPNWVAPIDDYRKPVTDEQNWLFANLPSYWHWYCYAMSVLDKQVEDLQVEDPAWPGGFNERNDLYRTFLTGYIRDKLADRPELIDACTPDYPPLARRLVVDNGWFDAMCRDDVTLVGVGIDRVVTDGIFDGDGRHHPLDAIVLGTGFRASDFLCSVDYVGNDGARIADLWATDGARAYLGMFVPQFPNFMIFYGPNGQPQSGSFHDWADRCARLAVDLMLQTIASGSDTFELSAAAYSDYNGRMDAAMREMIWGRDGSGGYYINPFGRPITKMPWRAHDYFAMIDGVPADAFRFA